MAAAAASPLESYVTLTDCSSASFSAMIGRQRVESNLLGGVGDQPMRARELAMHIRGGAGAGIQIEARTSEQIAALRCLGIGQSREYRLQRLRNVTRTCDIGAHGCEATDTDQGEEPDRERDECGPDRRGETKRSAGYHEARSARVEQCRNVMACLEESRRKNYRAATCVC